MGRIQVHCLCVSLDGFAAGPDQSPETPLGVGGTRLHEWCFATRAYREMIGESGGVEGPDSDFVAAGFDDWMHVTIVPTLLGAGEPLVAPDAGLPDRYVCTDDVPTDAVAHMVIERPG